MRKILSLVLSLAMVMSCFGMTAFAADETTNVVTELCGLVPTQGDSSAIFAVDTSIFNQTGTGAKVNGTYVASDKKYATGSFCGSADDTTVVYVGSNANDYSKNVINAADHSKLINSTFTDNDRILYSLYLNVYEGTQGNVYLMQKNQGINITDNLLHNAPLTVGEWAKVDIFYQPKVTYTYTKTNNNDATDVKTLTYSTNVIRAYNATAAADITKLLNGVTIEDGYTYELKGVKYGAYDTYVNGKLVYSSSGKTNSSLTYAFSTIPARITINNNASSTNLGIYMAQNSVSKVENFDASTYNFEKYPVLADGEKYDIYDKDVVLDGDVTVADITTSDDYVVSVYSSDDTTYSAAIDADYVIQAGDKILVRSGALNISYYTADIVTVNEYTDRYNNTYTWSINPYTGVLSIGVTDKIEDETHYGDIEFEWTSADQKEDSSKIAGNLAVDVTVAHPWQADSNKSKITSIDIHKDITQISRQAFYNLSGLTDITIPAHITNWGNWGTFGSCTNLKRVTYEYGSESIGCDKMFVNCTKLSEVILPPTVYKSYGRAFSGCTALKEIVITATHNSTSFPETIFENCSNVKVKYYAGSEAASKISGTTFANATTEAVAPAGLLHDRSGNADSIGWEVKDGVLRIYDVTSVGTGDLPLGNVSSTLTTFSILPWCHLGAFDEIIVEEGITSLSQWSLMEVQATTVTLPSTITSSDAYVFNGTSLITNLVFKEGFGAMGRSEMINRNCNIANIYLPSTATSINDSIFRGLKETDGNVYSGTTPVNFYAPKDSYAYTWATNMAADPAKDSGEGTNNEGKDATITVYETDSDRLYAYAVSGHKTLYNATNNTAGLSIGNGSYKGVQGADGGYDTALEVYSTSASQGNVFFAGPSFNRALFANRAYTVFEADVKFGANGEYFFFGSDQHKHVGDSVKYDSALVTDGWNKVVTVVDYNTGVSKTYVNGIYVATTNEAALWKDGDHYTATLYDKDGNKTGTEERICTSTRFVAYDLNEVSETVPALYIDNMAIYATDVNPADSYAAPLTASAYDATAGVTFTASDAVKALDSNIVIAAAYDANDNMVGKVVTGTDSVTIAPVAGAAKYVGYVWDSLTDLAPISACVPVSAQ
ncbi:MAG: leucine-rich repeat protein [Clostridia bacterium]|nr:leucine-rich repeat protein [Clostridia bacterium]